MKVIRNGLIMSMVPGEEPYVGSLSMGDDGLICEVGKDVNVPQHADIIEADRCLVLPGFIDAHRHCWMASTRSASGDFTIRDYIKYFRHGAMQHYRPEDIRISTLVGLLDALNSGITTAVDFAHCLNSEDHVAANLDAIGESGARAIYAVGFNETPGKIGGFSSLQERLENFRKLIQRKNMPELVTLWTSTSDIYDGVERMIQEIQASKDLDVPTTLHAGYASFPGLPSEVAAVSNAGLLHNKILWSHMPRATRDELLMVRDSGAHIVSVPSPELRGGQGFPVIGRWRALGGKPALGISNTGGGAHDLFGSMMLGLLVQRNRDHEEAWRERGVEQDVVSLPMREAVEWVTINGAEAVGMADKIGSLEVGKDADIAILRPGLFCEPVINPWATVVMQMSVGNVDTVLVKGKIVKKDGRLVRDMDAIEREFRRSHHYIGERNPRMRGPFFAHGSMCACGQKH